MIKTLTKPVYANIYIPVYACIRHFRAFHSVGGIIHYTQSAQHLNYGNSRYSLC